MKKVLALSMLLLTGGITLTSCKKETITNSTSNTYSQVGSIASATWALSTDKTSFSASVYSSSSNSFVSEQDAVLVYFDFNNDGTWDGPGDVFYNGYDFRSFHGTTSAGVNYVTIEYYAKNETGTATTTLDNTTDRFPNALPYKIVFIQAQDISKLKTVDLNNYNAVKSVLNLKD